MALIFSKNKYGEFAYDIKEVDTFFARIKIASGKKFPAASQLKNLDPIKILSSSFKLSKAGYYTREVDAAVDKLVTDIIFAQKEEITNKSGGAQNWEHELARMVYDLKEVLTSPRRSKFEKGGEPKEGENAEKQFFYKIAPVDKFLDKVYSYLFEGEKKVDLQSLDSLSLPATRSKRGYNSFQVDEYLNQVKVALIADSL